MSPKVPVGSTIVRVDPEEVKRRMDEGKIVFFVDSRRQQDWESSNSQLPFAIRIPPENPEPYLDTVPRDREIVTYCSCAGEESSELVARVLLDHGIRDPQALAGGFHAWIRAGYPTQEK